MPIPVLPRLLRPYITRELPGWGKLYRALGCGVMEPKGTPWAAAPVVTIPAKTHGLNMILDLKDPVQRMAYFTARYYDREVQAALDLILAPGDTLIDVGANIGMATLHAAARVGPKGRVIAIEPQPACAESVERHAQANHLSHVSVHRLGLSHTPGTLELNVIGSGTLCATFASDVNPADVREKVAVPVRRGDDIVPEAFPGRLRIKIDVEGYEFHVLRGFENTLARHRPVIVAELVPRHLQRAGTDPAALIAWLHEHGYRGHVVHVLGRRGTLRLTPITSIADCPPDGDAIWIHAEDRSVDVTGYLA